jgi:ribulose-5-phosphate 4-epimerase/fuculose-1-phosphate aldolase
MPGIRPALDPFDALKEGVAQACRILGRLDLTNAATGHVSARVPGTDRLLIRARGPGELGVRYTTKEEVIEVTLDGAPVAANSRGLDVPNEIFIHTEIYRARPQVNSVVHIHPPTVVLFTICDLPLLPLYGAYDPWGAQIALKGVPRYERSITIRNRDLGRDFVRTMGDSELCLMRGHGITAASRSIEEATLLAISLNELAVMNYRARLLGTPHSIPDEDRDHFKESRPDGGSPDATRSQRAAALWRYYLRLTDSA